MADAKDRAQPADVEDRVLPAAVVTSGRLFDPAPYEAELWWYLAAVHELLAGGADDPARWAARWAACDHVDARAEDVARFKTDVRGQEFLYRVGTKHGIVKDLGAGGVCALLRVHPALLEYGRDVVERFYGIRCAASELRSSMDSVGFIPTSVVDADPTLAPTWMHCDERLARMPRRRYGRLTAGAAATDGFQMVANLAPTVQDGPAGDACFVYSAESHTTNHDTRVRVLRAAGVPEEAIQVASRKDWVKLAPLVPLGAAARAESSPLWAGPLTRGAIVSGGVLVFPSNVVHGNAPFAVAGRPQPRLVRYVTYFPAPRLKGKPPGPGRHWVEMMTGITRKRSREGDENANPAVPPLLPIAYTTNHRGGAKNSSGKLPVFRAGPNRDLFERVNAALDRSDVRMFFTLPMMLARGLQFVHGVRVPLGALAEAIRTGAYKGPGDDALRALKLLYSA